MPFVLPSQYEGGCVERHAMVSDLPANMRILGLPVTMRGRLLMHPSQDRTMMHKMADC